MDSSPRKAWNKMPRGWNWERFRVVKAGNGQIALHSRTHNRFVRMNGKGGVDVSPARSWKKLPSGWQWERFTVVNAGNGQIALHNKAHNRFLRMNKSGRIDATPRRAASKLPRSWTWERFTVVRYKCRRVKKKIIRRPRRRPRRIRRRCCPKGSLLPGCTVALHNKAQKRFVSMNSKANTIASSRKSWYNMPKGWTWEWFTVVDAGNGQIALHSKAHNRFVRMN